MCMFWAVFSRTLLPRRQSLEGGFFDDADANKTRCVQTQLMALKAHLLIILLTNHQSTRRALFRMLFLSS
jgi:hypothetical protein